MNPFLAVGNVLVLAAFACAAAGVAIPGARAPLLLTAASLALPGLIMRTVGVKLGKLVGVHPSFVDAGLHGTAVITGIGDTGVTINNDPVVAFDLDVTIGDRRFSATLKQRTPRVIMGAVLPGSVVSVVADPEDASQVAIDWTQAPASGPRPGPGLEGVSAKVGEPVTGIESATDLLRTGRKGTAEVKSAKDAGDISELGVVAPDDSHPDDRLYILELEVKLPGRSPYPVRIGHRLPERLYGRVGPGMIIPVAVDRDDDQSVAIDWTTVT
ncbi:MAG: hypothetical protein A2Z12_08150 [Actinobacteria bacterium RBG_16_68_21]|nr:MAG: hypothetical protein A2Z12_08150 [Actinobacteria bacterium RBG_16_68_21]